MLLMSTSYPSRISQVHSKKACPLNDREPKEERADRQYGDRSRQGVTFAYLFLEKAVYCWLLILLVEHESTRINTNRVPIHGFLSGLSPEAAARLRPRSRLGRNAWKLNTLPEPTAKASATVRQFRDKRNKTDAFRGRD